MRIKIAWDMKKFATFLGFVLAVSGCAEGDPVDPCMDVDCSDGNDCV
ncbi:MAG: lipoprotein, partial [Deltaproteobacteria bacterium]|nr:lipoprotein [Deltaproteobacteria bacterium]